MQTGSHRAEAENVHGRDHAHAPAHTEPGRQGPAYQSPSELQADHPVPGTSTVPDMSIVLDMWTVLDTSTVPDIRLPRRPRQGMNPGKGMRSSARTPIGSEVGRGAQGEEGSYYGRDCGRDCGLATEVAQWAADKMSPHCSLDEARREAVQSVAGMTATHHDARMRAHRSTMPPPP